MNQEDVKLLESDGWVVECESPEELSHPETQSSVNGEYAVRLLLKALQEPVETVKLNKEDAAIIYKAKGGVEMILTNIQKKEYVSDNNLFVVGLCLIMNDDQQRNKLQNMVEEILEEKTTKNQKN